MCLEKPSAESRRERQSASGWGDFSGPAAILESRASLPPAAMSIRSSMYGEISVRHRAEFQVDQCRLISRQQTIKRVDRPSSRSPCNVQNETLTPKSRFRDDSAWSLQWSCRRPATRISDFWPKCSKTLSKQIFGYFYFFLAAMGNFRKLAFRISQRCGVLRTPINSPHRSIRSTEGQLHLRRTAVSAIVSFAGIRRSSDVDAVAKKR
jgi:hypothetical protein